jgi:hypothetical protein
MMVSNGVRFACRILLLGLGSALLGCADSKSEGPASNPPMMEVSSLRGPWDGMDFSKDTPMDCDVPGDTRISFPALINGDWDTAGLEEIPVDYIIELTDTALQTSDHGPAACAFKYLQYFASKDAFYLQNDCSENNQMALHDYERSLFTAPMIGLPILKLKGDAAITETDWKTIEPWLRKLLSCHQIMLKDRLSASYITDFGGYHNSIYNVSLAGISFAIALNDEEMLKEFASGFSQALDRLNDDGTSQYEINEKGEATWFYHNYMSNYASHVALLTDMNGYNFLHHDKLVKMRKLVSEDLAGAKNFEAATGIVQSRSPADEPWNLTWTYHLARIDKDASLRMIADQYDGQLVHTMTSGAPSRWWLTDAWLHTKYGSQ